MGLGEAQLLLLLTKCALVRRLHSLTTLAAAVAVVFSRLLDSGATTSRAHCFFVRFCTTAAAFYSLRTGLSSPIGVMFRWPIRVEFLGRFLLLLLWSACNRLCLCTIALECSVVLVIISQSLDESISSVW